MRTVTITRAPDGTIDDEGTFGKLVTDKDFKCVTIELPWRDNKPDISCVPKGTYLCTWRFSEKHGLCYWLENVPGRSSCEIHSANVAGDISKGWASQLEGCIAPGKETVLFPGGVHPCRDNAQYGVNQSKDTLLALQENLRGPLGQESFMLTIQ